MIRTLLRLPVHAIACAVALAALAGASGCAGPGAGNFSAASTHDTTQAAFARWLEAHAARMEPLNKAVSLTYWNATASGKKEDYDAASAAELAVENIYSDRSDFEYIKAVRAAGQVRDPQPAREVEKLYLRYLGNQFDPELLKKITALSSSIEEKFNTARAEVAGRKLADNEVEDVLKTNTDTRYRREVWEASKRIGAVVDNDVVALVKLRNEAARQLGYENYYVLSLAQGEQNEQDLIRLLDDMADRTDAPFREVKAELDAALAQRYGIQVADLRPWHYEDRFFQEPPSVGSVDLDSYYRGKDVAGLTAQFYESLGMPGRDILVHSDLAARPGKYQHAYCTDIDRRGDVRVMASVKDDEISMETMLHEMGHGVYARGTDANAALPYFLRGAAHSLTTEGYALLTGRLATNPYWMQRFLGISDAQREQLDPPLRRKARVGALVFARWCQVMAHFERDLYRNPDQDLNALWYRYVARYQLLTPPEGRNAPDWASKIHLVTNPVYYHNYLLGELYAAQLHARVAATFFPGVEPWKVIYADRKDVGKFFDEKVFRPGAQSRWDAFVVDSTGEPLSARAFAAAYVSPGK